jgi:hypothetical protein
VDRALHLHIVLRNHADVLLHPIRGAGQVTNSPGRPTSVRYPCQLHGSQPLWGNPESCAGDGWVRPHRLRSLLLKVWDTCRHQTEPATKRRAHPPSIFPGRPAPPLRCGHHLQVRAAEVERSSSI